MPQSPASLNADLAELRPEEADPVVRTSAWAHRALDAGLLDLPLPGRGRTQERFDALADLGGADLDLARLAEAHTDALAIRADLLGLAQVATSSDPESRELWGVWAANPPVDPLRARRDGDRWVLTGTKPWCSGAGCCDRALVTAQTDDGYRLFATDLHHPGASPVDGTWPAAAMQGSDSRSVCFDGVPAQALGGPDDYLLRSGFWHGAVGVAAVWFGGAREVARALFRSDQRRPLKAHALAHVGAIDAALCAAAAVLAAAAVEFDSDPEDEAGTARLTAARVRAVVERTAEEILARTGRALGAAPLALDQAHGRRVSDLALYLRQSHAETDLEGLGRAALDAGGPLWNDVSTITVARPA